MSGDSPSLYSVSLNLCEAVSIGKVQLTSFCFFSSSFIGTDLLLRCSRWKRIEKLLRVDASSDLKISDWNKDIHIFSLVCAER